MYILILSKVKRKLKKKKVKNNKPIGISKTFVKQEDIYCTYYALGWLTKCGIIYIKKKSAAPKG